jgi:NADPH-dependent F420 reductase
MKIGILGKGNVGATLGKAWAGAGHEVMFGVRNALGPQVSDLLREIGTNAQAGSLAEAAAFGQVVVLAVPWLAAKDAVQQAGDLSGKIVIDCTNPLNPNGDGLSVGHITSAGEEVAHWLPKARVVKAFNSTGSGNMADPVYGSQRASMFVCSDDAEAKTLVVGLGQDIGFEMIDAGPLANARLLEPLAMLWIYLAYRQGLGPDIAFKLLRR